MTDSERLRLAVDEDTHAGDTRGVLRAEVVRLRAELNDARREVLDLCGYLGRHDDSATLADAVRAARLELEKDAAFGRALKGERSHLRGENARLRDRLGHATDAIRHALDNVGMLAAECPGLAAALENHDEGEGGDPNV